MHILLINDDGIFAEGIYKQYLELKKFAKVTIVAPDSERSSIGHAITLAHPLLYKKIYRQGNFFGYGLSGTPADCVKFAIAVLLKTKPDVVVSGINLGANDGCSVFYSGTVGAAREGALLGIPSMAISLDTFVNPDFSYAAKCGAKLTKTLIKSKMPPGIFLNVNVPHKKPSKIKGIKVTRQGMIPIHSAFRKRIDPGKREYYWMTGKIPSEEQDDSRDTYALNKGYVTVTPLHCEATDNAFYEKLSQWKL